MDYLGIVIFLVIAALVVKPFSEILFSAIGAVARLFSDVFDRAPRRIVWYHHHGRLVATFKDTKGRHRDLCLCYRCEKLKPDDPDNCRIAQSNLNGCLQFGTVQPVLECPEFKNSAVPVP